jgi:ribulose-phosphate 3-epimerase
MYKLAPSILSADFAVLGSSLAAIQSAGAHYVHFDVMDGHFVPNISFGVPVLKSIRRCTNLVFDVHLMINNPENYLEPFALAGADLLCIHTEAMDEDNLNSCLAKIQSMGKKAAIAIKPHTPLDSILPYLEQVSMVLIMSVEPGFGGQSLLPFTLGKAERLANYIKSNNLNIDIEMDGGIDRSNLRSVLNAGVNVVVAGSSIFETGGDISTAVKGFLETFSSFEALKNKKKRV